MSWLDVLRRWAWSDRIRVSPGEGKLLRLPVGACVRVSDMVAHVSCRTVREGVGTAGEDGRVTGQVDYTCRAAAGEFLLRVCPEGSTSAVRVWMIRGDGQTHEVAAHDVETFGRVTRYNPAPGGPRRPIPPTRGWPPAPNAECRTTCTSPSSARPP